MDIDFETFFKDYEALLAMADDVFERMKKDYPDEVKCKIRCADCCHALFDLSLIEAIYLNHHFNKHFQGKEREVLLEKANRIDRKTYKIKQKAYKALKSGKTEGEILEEMAAHRIRCPLLNDQEKCDLYDYRPITCRFYGLPTSIGGTGHTCGLSGFVRGKEYPTVKLDIIQEKLFALSQAFVREIKSRHYKMANMLVPLSMAILTKYDDAYLGVGDTEKADAVADEENRGDTDG